MTRQTIHHGDKGVASVEWVPSGIVLRMEMDAPDVPATALHMTREQAKRLAFAIIESIGGRI